MVGGRFSQARGAVCRCHADEAGRAAGRAFGAGAAKGGTVVKTVASQIKSTTE